ncbi:hypothetical protein BU17DRAFT_46753 [Hysterangium stoloniferum]|nr:hypothetical protein BU17DRAFT_46753 [Hysterangium stoloniferum]
MSTTTIPSKNKPILPLGDILHDLALIRAFDINLQAILMDGQDGPSSHDTSDADVSVQQSYEFAEEARAALKIKSRGDLAHVGATVERVREGLDDVLRGLGAPSPE